MSSVLRWTLAVAGAIVPEFTLVGTDSGSAGVETGVYFAVIVHSSGLGFTCPGFVAMVETALAAATTYVGWDIAEG